MASFLLESISVVSAKNSLYEFDDSLGMLFFSSSGPSPFFKPDVEEMRLMVESLGLSRASSPRSLLISRLQV
jgi:hypothetical protein